MPTAVLIDGGFFLKRFPYVYRDRDANDPKVVARTMQQMAHYHLTDPQGRTTYELYRIFFYDCPPILKKAHYPISRRGIDFSKTPAATFRLNLHEELRKAPEGGAPTRAPV